MDAMPFPVIGTMEWPLYLNRDDFPDVFPEPGNPSPRVPVSGMYFPPLSGRRKIFV
jgi:hypothetical protein